MDRRSFLQTTTTATATAALAIKPSAAKAAPNERLQVGVIGAGGRALGLNKIFAENPQADVVAIADIDPSRFGNAVKEVESRQGKKPATVADFRTLIEDNSLDAIVVGTPDHWHAIPTIMACQAGKDVYVEKPDGHNIVEGQRMVAAMKKHSRIVQLGSQHRSTERMKTALAYLGEGHLGKCLVAKAWESTKQGSIGHPPDSPVPPGVNYDMWLGAAPKRPFNKRRFHGNWRWFHDYGTGDLGNDGVHRLDMAIAALNAAAVAQGESQVALPSKISAAGGKWYFDDMQEFPDTLQVNYEFAGKPPKLLTYEMRIWSPHKYHGEGEAAAIYGDQGYMVLANRRWRAFDAKGKLVKEVKGDTDAGPHVQNFIDCVKSREKPACDLETIGHPASVLCHSGNIAARVGRTLTLDAETEMFVNDDDANQLRTREEYRKPWLLPEV